MKEYIRWYQANPVEIYFTGNLDIDMSEWISDLVDDGQVRGFKEYSKCSTAIRMFRCACLITIHASYWSVIYTDKLTYSLSSTDEAHLQPW